MWLQLIFLSVALSIDGFGVGVSLGMRRMKIPFKSIVVISICSAISLGVAMVIGEFISQHVSQGAAEKTGGIILIFLGVWMVFQFFKKEKETTEIQSKEKIIFNFEIKSLGVVINILQKPSDVDFDKSGTINGVEALVLGVCTFAGCVWCGNWSSYDWDFPINSCSSIGCMSSIFIWSGLQSGKLLSKIKLVKHLSFLPGILLIIIGIFKL